MTDPATPPPTAPAPGVADDPRRTLGLFGATAIGVGAIVGGGILALAGTAFAVAGPAALLAFALNGVIGFLTVASFAELSSRFPVSGGSYAFAKRVLSVRAAFTIGWIVWFASIVAGVLYALGFAEFALLAAERLLPALGVAAPAWLDARAGALALAGLAVLLYAAQLSRATGGGGDWATIGKVVAFAVLIVAGLIAVARAPGAAIGGKLEPFAPAGLGGILAAMGYSFVAFQGFDLIAAAAGEVRRPSAVLPRSMALSLGLAVAIYLPLLFIVATVGVPAGGGVRALAQEDPATLIAVAAGRFLGPAGFWLVVVAAVLSMLSALQANLFAASRIAMAMARDRTLPRALGGLTPTGTPATAVWTSAVAMIAVALLLPDVATAGAAAGLIFLAIFALAHVMAYLARARSGDSAGAYRAPLFPLVPIVGGVACAGLAAFQGVAVPAAGVVALAWIALGVALYLRLFAHDARALDALAEARDPDLLRLRGRSPLVLAPVANPASAAAMLDVASSLAPRGVGRVLLLSVVPSAGGDPQRAAPRVEAAQGVLREALRAALDEGLAPEALTTLADDPWREIARVSDAHRCESLLLGLSDLTDEGVRERVNRLIREATSDVVVLRAPPGWRLRDARRVLVPIAGKGGQEELRARLLGALARVGQPEIAYLRVVPGVTTEASRARLERGLARLAEDREIGGGRAEVIASDDALSAIAERAADADLLVLGLQRVSRGDKSFGRFTRELVARVPPTTAVVLISRKG